MTQVHELFKDTVVLVKQAWADGKYTPMDYLYLVMLAHTGPSGGFTIDSVEVFCQEWNLTQSQFKQATAALVKKGVFEETIISLTDPTGLSPDSDPVSFRASR